LLKKITTSNKSPSKALELYINRYWTAYNPTNEQIEVPIVPDGCMDIIWKDGYLFLSGLMELADVITIEPHERYFGIQFKPYALALLLGEDVSKFNNQSISLDSINDTLKSKMSKLIESSEPYDALDEYFAKFFFEKVVEPKLVMAVKIIRDSYGNVSVTDLVDRLEMHPKKLERLFVPRMGVSVKKFSKIVRFHEVHKVLSEEGLENLSSKVLEKGYFDQAHFNRDFKKLTGLKPSSKLMSILYNTKA
jgi:AraC-like DNA-binding protein